MQLWEILIPVFDNAPRKFPLEHHWAWDREILKLAGGITILKEVKGKWAVSDQKSIDEDMLVVRIACDIDTMRKILVFTQYHYKQVDVMAYKVSDRVIMYSDFGGSENDKNPTTGKPSV